MARWFFTDTWLGTVVLAAVVMMALTVLIVTVVDAVAETVTPIAERSWNESLKLSESALAVGDVPGSLRHWRDAYATVLATRRWEGLVEAGDAYRRIGARGGFAAAAVRGARDCYLTALLRARGERSLDGVLRATEAFLDLGDDEVVEQGLAIARQVAARDADPRGLSRVDMLAARWAARSAAARDNFAPVRSGP